MKYIYTTSSESYIYIFTVFNGILFFSTWKHSMEILFVLFSTFFLLETHTDFPDLYEKTPPMSPRRVARDVIETLDTDGNGKKLFFIFS